MDRTNRFPQTKKEIQLVCDGIKELLLEKNAKYGDSALQPKRVFSSADPVEQIKVRIDDKLSRIATTGFSAMDEDTLQDLIGYLVLLKIALGRKEPIRTTYEDVVEALAAEANEWEFPHGLDDVIYYNAEANKWEFPHGLDDVIYYNAAEAGATKPDVDDQPLDLWEAEDSDWAAFWDSDDDYMWDPSLGPVELTDKEIQDILDRKDLQQFGDNEIVSTIEKRGFFIGVKADGTTCELGKNGRCV